MAIPSEMLRTLITSKVVAGSYSLYTGESPPTPDKVVVLRDTTGEPPNPSWLLDYPGVQIEIRSIRGGYIDAREMAQTLKDTLLGVTSQDILGDRLVAINLFSDIAFIGADASHRPIFTFNLALIVQPATNADTNREPIP